MVIISIIKNRKKIYRKEGNKVIEIAAMILGADMRNIMKQIKPPRLAF